MKIISDLEYAPGMAGDLFLPDGPAPAGGFPAALVIHGGGWTGMDRHAVRGLAEFLAENGFAVFNIDYRLAPQHPHPVFFEDCYAAMCYAYDHADALGIDPERMGVGGDSAGGTLAAAVCQMARDRGTEIPCFQLLVYPVIDRRMESESNQRFTDTPVWNSTLSKLMVGGYVQNPNVENYVYASPIEGSCENLPKAYIETAEFDCLHDDGIHYAEKLRDAGIAVEVNETKGTMHGFDIAQRVHTAVNMDNIGIFKAAYHMYDGIYFTDIA